MAVSMVRLRSCLEDFPGIKEVPKKLSEICQRSQGSVLEDLQVERADSDFLSDRLSEHWISNGLEGDARYAFLLAVFKDSKISIVRGSQYCPTIASSLRNVKRDVRKSFKDLDYVIHVRWIAQWSGGMFLENAVSMTVIRPPKGRTWDELIP